VIFGKIKPKMTTKDLLKLSTRIFTARKGRTALTVLGMGIGFGAILFLVSLGYGLQGALLENITSSGALSALDVGPNEQEGKLLTPEAVAGFEKIDGVAGIETSYDLNARLKFGDTGLDARSIVASPGYIELDGLKTVAGRKPSENGAKEILVSSAVGKIFGKNPEEMVGQGVSLVLLSPAGSGSPDIAADGYFVSGVTEGDEAAFSVFSKGIGIPADVNFSKVKVKCESSEYLTSAKDAILKQGFSVSSLSETVSEVNKMFRVVNVILGLFGIITLGVSAIGMFNTMTVTLLERTTEIGIMRSVGASRSNILLMFVIESTLMGFAGGVAGIVFGIASGQVVNLIVNIVANYMGGRSLHLFSYPLWFLGVILLFSILIGFVTGIGPAKRASSLDPLEALRSR
jgi:ABC-type antimicrobial peptide transport system permease subunit